MKNILLSFFLIGFNLFFTLFPIEASTSRVQDRIVQEILTRQDITQQEGEELVVKYLFLWIDKHNSFFVMNDLKQEFSKRVDINFYDIYRRYFNNPAKLIEKMIEMDKEEKYLKYILQTKIPEEIYRNEKLRKKIQTSFIKNYLFPWMNKNKRFLAATESLEYNGVYFSTMKIYRSYTSTAMFDNETDLMKKVIEVDVEEKYIKYIVLTKITSELCRDNDIYKEKISKSFIKDYLFPWMDKNKRFPGVKDFHVNGKASLEMSFSKVLKILGVDNVHKGFIELIRSIIKYDDKEQYLKYIVKYDFSQECYSDQYIVEKIKKSFIKDFLIHWLDKYERWPMIADFGNGENKIGIGYYKTFGIMNRIGIFDSMESLIEKMVEIDVEDRYLKYIFQLDAFSSLYLNEKIRNKLQIVFIKEYLFPWAEVNTDYSSLEKDFVSSRIGLTTIKVFGRKKEDVRVFDSYCDLVKKAIQIDTNETFVRYLLKIGLPPVIYKDDEIRNRLNEVFIKDYIFPWLEKNGQLPISERNFNMDSINYPRQKIFWKGSMVGLFVSYKEFIEKIIKLDTKEQYIKYLLKLYTPQECYIDNNIRKKFQYIFITKYIFPWLDKYKRLPTAEEYSLDNEDMDIPYSRIFSKIRTVGIFDSYKGLISAIIELDKEDKYLKYLINSKLSQETVKDEKIRKVLQIVFIKHYLSPLIKKYGRFPSSRILKKEYKDMYHRFFYSNSTKRSGIFDDIGQLESIYTSLYSVDVNYIEEFKCKTIFVKGQKSKKSKKEDL